MIIFHFKSNSKIIFKHFSRQKLQHYKSPEQKPKLFKNFTNKIQILTLNNEITRELNNRKRIFSLLIIIIPSIWWTHIYESLCTQMRCLEENDSSFRSRHHRCNFSMAALFHQITFIRGKLLRPYVSNHRILQRSRKVSSFKVQSRK